jgi:hypothetical protein
VHGGDSRQHGEGSGWAGAKSASTPRVFRPELLANRPTGRPFPPLQRGGLGGWAPRYHLLALREDGLTPC